MAMKLLINDKEIMSFMEQISKGIIPNEVRQRIKDVKFLENEINEVVYHVLEKKQAGKIKKIARKVPGKVERAVKNDLRAYLDQVKQILDEYRIKKKELIKKHYRYIINKFGEERIYTLYRNDPHSTGFIKSVGLQIYKGSQFCRRETFTDLNENCLLRNTVGNEKLLVHKIDNNLPFWFIDSGYTNFLEGKQKVWHRLTMNHIHQTGFFNAPVDRLGNFKHFPKQWRTGGEYILIIEPGQFSSAIFHVDIKKWKYEIVKEIRKYSDKKIRFRPKINKKIRRPLYNALLDDDYYCTISINSNAATESIWAGVPTITLHKHITNAVATNTISEINQLSRPNLAQWLCMLSYSQFTYEELVDGTAYNIVQRYHVHSQHLP